MEKRNREGVRVMWFPLKAYPPPKKKHKELQLGTILKGPEYLLMCLPWGPVLQVDL